MYVGLLMHAASHPGFPTLTDGGELFLRKEEEEELEAGKHWHKPPTVLISIS